MKELTVGLIASAKLIGAGVGIGVLFGFFIASLGRNLFLEDKLLKYLFLGFVLTKAMGLLALMLYN